MLPHNTPLMAKKCSLKAFECKDSKKCSIQLNYFFFFSVFLSIFVPDLQNGGFVAQKAARLCLSVDLLMNHKWSEY